MRTAKTVTGVSMNSPSVLFVGRSTLDVLYSLDHLPDEDSKIYAREMHAAPGGPALNAAITHALLGGKATLISAVGNGLWASHVHAELERHGIALIDLAARAGYEIPLSTVLINTGASTRTIVNPPLSNVPLKPLEATWNRAWGEMPPLILTDGFHLKETMALLASCRGAGATICLDGGSWKPGTDELAELLTVAICSERFAVPGYPHSVEATLKWFAAKAVPQSAITRGASSIMGSDHGRAFEIEVENIEACDTSGAGDVLHGAFCFHFGRTRKFEPSLRHASQIATRSCRSLGIQEWITKSAPERL